MMAGKVYIALLRREFQLEGRRMSSMASVGLFALLVVFILFMLLGQPETEVWLALFWVAMTFTGLITVGPSFGDITDGRWQYEYQLATPTQLLLARFSFNVVYMVAVGLLQWLMFAIFLGNPLPHPWHFLGLVIIGSMALAMTFGFMSAITSRATKNFSTLAVLSLPVVLPVLMLLINASEALIARIVPTLQFWKYMGVIGAAIVLILALSMLLFPYLWRD